jgi:siroheme synthase-like protein
MPATYMPISIFMDEVNALVVGGGNVALRKVDNLLDYKCKVTVVAPEVHEKIAYYGNSGRIRLEQREYRTMEASGYGLVIAASDDTGLNKQIHEDCKSSGVLVNVVDIPKQCSFVFPAVVRRDRLTISVSTDGKAPFLAAYLKTFLDDLFPKHWEKIVQYAAKFRKLVIRAYKDDAEAKHASYSRFLGADWMNIIKKKDPAEIEETLQIMLTESGDDEQQ